MALAQGQPRIRFAEHFNPGDIAALCYTPKVVTIKKTITATVADEVAFAIPAECYVSKVIGICKTTCASTDAELHLGVTGATDQFLNATNFDLSTVTWYENSTGYYYTEAKNVIVTVTGTTVTNGVVEVVIEMYDVAKMFQAGGVHVDL